MIIEIAPITIIISKILPVVLNIKTSPTYKGLGLPVTSVTLEGK
ncbi:hypothetical protein [Saccharolobus islandicus]|nr:hypothetical protein [Sulfolobus islandicus]